MHHSRDQAACRAAPKVHGDHALCGPLCSAPNRRTLWRKAHYRCKHLPYPAPTVKALVVYFSRTGQTTRIAKEIARRCDAHLDAIHLEQQGESWVAHWRYHWHALTHAEPPIQRPERNPANYDIVVVGVPVSRTGLAPPVRSYVHQYGPRIKRLALFCAEGRGLEEQGFSELSRLYGKKPVATCGISSRHLPTIASRKQLIDFVDSMRDELPHP
jgi:flavodoxin